MEKRVRVDASARKPHCWKVFGGRIMAHGEARAGPGRCPRGHLAAGPARSCSSSSAAAEQICRFRLLSFLNFVKYVINNWLNERLSQ